MDRTVHRITMHPAMDKRLAVRCEGLCKHYPHFELQDVDLAFGGGGHCEGTGRALFVGAEEVLLGGFLPLAVGLDRCAAVGGVTQWLTSVFHAKILDNRLSHFDREFLLSGRTCSVERSTIDAT